MTTEATGEAIRAIQTLFQGVVAGLPDDELVRRFVDRDESAGSAFEVLLDRHGPAVWAVCRRTLADPADALDAFQATFLVLVRKAGSIRVEHSLGPWLHGVSLKVARRARAVAARRRSRERTNAEGLDRATSDDPPVDDLRALLDLELARLPARYRSPLSLCYLEGLTHEEAATRLSCPVGTVRSRLARGRGLLRDRLTRRGLAPSIVGAALALDVAPASAALPRALVASTLSMALARSATGPAASLAAEVGRAAIVARIGRSAVVAMVVLGFAGAMVVRNREGNDAPLPARSVAEIADQIEEVSGSYAKGLIEVEYDEVKVDHFSRPLIRLPDPIEDRVPPKPPAAKLKYKDEPGRSRYASDGVRWKAEMGTYDAKMIPQFGKARSETRSFAGFDGKLHYQGYGSFQTIMLAEGRDDAQDNGAERLFWENGKTDAIFKDVMVEGAEVSQRTIDGFRCYVVRSTSDQFGKSQVREVVISPRQSYLPLAMTQTLNGQAEVSKRVADLRKLPDGRWYPARITVERRFEVDGQGFVLDRRRETRVIKFEPDHVFTPDELALKIPVNTKVLDRRTGVFYRNDPWWPELRDYLAREFDWPRADLSPLDGLYSPNPDLDGKPAPPILADGWIRGGPVSWASLKGKVVLVVFSRPGDFEVVPPLRRLRAAYAKDGLEIVEVFPRSVARSWADRMFEEFDVDHPVLFDAVDGSSSGAMSSAFGGDKQRMPRPIDRNKSADATAIPAYLVDPRGQVHAIAEGGWSKAIVDQLRLAGSTTAKPLLPPEDLGFGVRMFKFPAAWRGWTKQASATARLVGKVVDGQGRPVAGAKLRCLLYAGLLQNWMTILTLTGSDPIEVTTGPDGSFSIPGLCKGCYGIEVEAKGRASAVRNAIIGTELGDIDPKIVLDQADEMSGIVKDEAGRPIAGALIEVFNRHFDSEFNTTTYALMIKRTATTDADGRFRVISLLEGLYSIAVTAPGRAGQNHEEVPAGASGLEFKLAVTKSP